MVTVDDNDFKQYDGFSYTPPTIPRPSTSNPGCNDVSHPGNGCWMYVGLCGMMCVL